MSYPKKHVRAMNEPFRATLPSDPVTPPEPRQKVPFDPFMSDMLLKNLFYYFQMRGFAITKSRFEDGPEHPRVVDVTGEDNHEGEYLTELETLEVVQEAGIEYVEEFLDFTMNLLVDH